jgi:hypothetical protein
MRLSSSEVAWPFLRYIRNEVSTGSGSDRVSSRDLDHGERCDPVATAPGTDFMFRSLGR